MKKLLAALLALILCLPLVACSSSSLEEIEKTEETPVTEKKTEEKKEEEEPLPTGEIVYPEGFSVGYNRQDVTPTVFPIATYEGNSATSAHDPVQLTITAMSDGETAFLLCSLDMRAVPYDFVDACAKIVEKAVGVPKERLFFNTTHTHSAPDNARLGEGNMVHWQRMFMEKLERGVILAMHDLSPAKAYVGTGYTEDITFVRRYLMDDGTYVTNPTMGIPVAHETEADNQMRTIRFDREEGKDVLLVSYQTHYGSATALYPNQISADFVHPLRESVEKELDCHFAYQNSAGANLNFESKLPGERKYPTFLEAIPPLVQCVKDALASEKEVAVNTLHSAASNYPGKCWDRGDLDDGFSGTTREVRLYAVSIGDIAFCAAPYEMFDTHGKAIREASPFAMTFVCANTNGVLSYVPSALAYSHGGYETVNCYFAPGSGEEFQNELIRLLNDCKAQQNS